MSVIAFDGKSIAADRIGVTDGMRTTSTKLWKVGQEILATYGDPTRGAVLRGWWIRGGKEEDFPARPKDPTNDDLSTLIVVTKNVVRVFVDRPVTYIVEDRFMAWGAGRDFAMGAMAMGATAEQAVEVACRLSIYCGMGIDVFHLSQIQ